MTKMNNQQGVLIRAIETEREKYWYFCPRSADVWSDDIRYGLIFPKKEVDDEGYEKIFEGAIMSLIDYKIRLKDVEILDVALGYCASKKISVGDMTLIKQKVALSKLTLEEVKALGVEEIAALHKLSDTAFVEDEDEKGNCDISMEDILGSIRRIIHNEDETYSMTSACRAGQSTRTFNLDEINNILGSDKNGDEEQDDLAAEWESSLS